MNYFNFNGKIFEEDTAVIGASNRGLRYGDGLFETMKYRNKELILADEHFARLWKGMQLLKFDIPKLLTADNLQEQIIQLMKKNKHADARVRLCLIRGNGGVYDVKNHSPIYLIQSWPLLTDNTILNQNGLQLCIFSGAKKMTDSFCNIKHNNYLPYFMGALFAKEQQCNDAIILNNYERICDSTIANVFVIKDEAIYTPSLNEGCVAGTMRKFIIQNIDSSGYSVIETEITKEMLLDADEVFLSNSIYNIRWVAAIETKKYSNIITRKIFEALSKTKAAVFC
ncbi:MAG: aminotransferase class IV [Ferruginibacter sp.]